MFKDALKNLNYRDFGRAIAKNAIAISGALAIFLILHIIAGRYGFFSNNMIAIIAATAVMLLFFESLYRKAVKSGFGKPYFILFRDLKESQGRYSSLAESSPEAIAVYCDDAFLYMNQAGLALFGAKNFEEIAGKKTLDFVHPNYRNSIKSYVQKLKRGQKPEPLKEFKILRLNGEVRYVEAIRSEIIYQNKDATQIVIRDITDRKRKEETLQRASEFNKTLLNTIPFAIDIVDEKGNTLFLSKKLEKAFGLSALGKKCWELYKDDKKQCERCPLKKGVAIGKTEDIETYGAFGGKIFKIVHTGMVFEGKKAVMEIFRDITEQKSIEKITEDSRVYAENIVDTIREPLVVLSTDLKVVSANWFFYYVFRFLKEQVESKPFFEIYDRYWDIPELKARLKKLAKENAPFHNFEIDHIFYGSDKRAMMFSARQIYQVGHMNPRILLVIKDITERKRAEEAMRVSEKKYRYLFDNASDAIVAIDAGDKILSWNKSAERIFGWKQEEVMGQRFPDLMVPSTLKKGRKNIVDEVLSGKNFAGVETVRTKKDGTKINVSLALSPLINEKKEIIGLSAIIRDITERKREEKRLKFHAKKLEKLMNDLEKFKLAVENVSEHVVITDAEGAILYANKGAEEITGYAKKDMLDKKAGGKFLWGSQMDEKFYQDLWKTIKEDKKSFIGELVNKRKNGEKYAAEIRVSPILDADGNVVFFVGVERDITKEKEIDRAKTEFVSMASHQLRTPLANMSLSLEMVLDGIAGEIDKDQKKYLTGIYRDIRGMAGLIDTLLNVSRIELRTLVIEPEPTDLKEISELVLREFAPEIRKKNLEVKTSYEKSLPVVNIDRNLTRIILQNLFSNAIKYTPPGGVIAGKIRKDKKNAIIEVADTGFGIPADQQQKIFSKMFRARNAADSKNEGVGLGLYIAKSIVEQSGGRIWFESPVPPKKRLTGRGGAKNIGTVFYVSVPLEGMKKRA